MQDMRDEGMGGLYARFCEIFLSKIVDRTVYSFTRMSILAFAEIVFFLEKMIGKTQGSWAVPIQRKQMRGRRVPTHIMCRIQD